LTDYLLVEGDENFKLILGGTLVSKSSFTQDSSVLVGTGAGTYAEETGATLRTSIGLGTTDSPQFNSLFVNDTVNTAMTIGITVNQGANDNAILSLKSSDVGHPVTGLTETDTFFEITKRDGDLGGVSLYSVTDGDVTPFQIAGTFGVADPSDLIGAVTIVGRKYDGDTNVAALGDDETVLDIKNLTTTVFRVTGSGDVTASLIGMTEAYIGESFGSLYDLTIRTTDPSIVLYNNTEEDDDGGRYGTLDFYGERSGGEPVQQARVGGCHDGSGDDNKGRLHLYAHDGSALEIVLTVDSSKLTTLTGNLVIPDAGYIGSASDTDAIQIAANGNVTVSSDLIVVGNYPSARAFLFSLM